MPPRGTGASRTALLVALVAAVALAAFAWTWSAAVRRNDAAATARASSASPPPSSPATADAARSDVDARSPDRAGVYGLVVDRSDAPIAEAKCSAVSLARGEVEEVESDRVGSFSFARVPEGELRLVVEAEGFLVHNEAADAAARGARRIVLRRKPVVRGRVVDSITRAPMPSFVVALLQLEEGEPLPSVVEPPPGSLPFSGSDGRFEAGAVAEGPHALCVLTERGAPLVERIVLRADEAVERELVVARGVRVRGRVRDANGDLVVEASVRLAAADGPQAAAVTGVDGSFALPALPAGSYELLVLPQAAPFLRESSRTLDAASPEPFFELTLPEPASMTGRVEPWTAGAAAEVVVRHAEGPVRRTVVDAATGAFALRDLAPGRAFVHVERTDPNWRSRVARAIASEIDPVAIELLAGRESDVAVQDPSAGLARLRGSVRGLREGEACVVRAFCESRPVPQAYEGLLRAMPQPDGSFEIDGLLAGRWRVQAMRGDDVLVWQAIEVAAGADLEVALRVR